LSITSTNNNNFNHPSLDVAVRSSSEKNSNQNGCVRGNLGHIIAHITAVLEFLQDSLPVGYQKWEYVEVMYTKTHIMPYHDKISKSKQFNTLIKKKHTLATTKLRPPLTR
jgi:hypothetical protein